MNEIQYRAVNRDSYSSIKDFLEDRKKYYKKYVLGEDVKTRETSAMILGNLVDCLLLEPEKFDEKYCLAQCQSPKPQMKRLSEALFERTTQDLDEEGTQLHSIDYLLTLAYNDVKYDRDGNDVAFKQKGNTEEKVKAEFLSGTGFLWYKELRSSYGRTLVTPREVTMAENVVRELKTSEVTKDIIGTKDGDRYTVRNQEKILFNWSGVELKCMVDKIIVDHEDNIVHVYDLKTTWDVEDNFMRNFFNQRYYIQALVYHIAVMEWIREQDWYKPGRYKVLPMKFIVADSGNNMAPLIYECDKDVLQKAMDGFDHNNREYIGLKQALEEIQWHKNTGKWNVSAENLQNKGVVKIKF